MTRLVQNGMDLTHGDGHSVGMHITIPKAFGIAEILNVCCILLHRESGAIDKRAKNPLILDNARVAELADALDLGSSGLNHRGSSPLSRIFLFNSSKD